MGRLELTPSVPPLPARPPDPSALPLRVRVPAPRARTSETRALPDFVVVGAMRAGTSSLAHHLRQHPGVFMPQQKELHFFDSHFSRGVAWYERFFQDAPDGSSRGEATPNYLYVAAARRRLSELLPGARLVVVLRDPVERAYSHYLHNLYRGREDLPFEEALAAEPSRLATSGQPWRYAYVDKGRYHDQLVDLVRLCGSERLLVLLFEEWVQQPRAAFGTVCQHLGIDTSFVPPDIGRQVNPATPIRSVWLRDRAKPLPKLIRDGIGRLNTRPPEHRPMRPETRHALIRAFTEDVGRLERLLGRHLDCWAQEPGR